METSNSGGKFKYFLDHDLSKYGHKLNKAQTEFARVSKQGSIQGVNIK